MNTLKVDDPIQSLWEQLCRIRMSAQLLRAPLTLTCCFRLDKYDRRSETDFVQTHKQLICPEEYHRVSKQMLSRDPYKNCDNILIFVKGFQQSEQCGPTIMAPSKCTKKNNNKKYYQRNLQAVIRKPFQRFLLYIIFSPILPAIVEKKIIKMICNLIQLSIFFYHYYQIKHFLLFTGFSSF